MRHSLILFALLLSGFFGSEPDSLLATQPNIVLIMADDMGFADTSPYGGESWTPNLTARSGTDDGTGEELTNRDTFFEHEHNRGVRSDKWKLVAPSGSRHYESYDLSVDHAESNDLSSALPEVQDGLRQKWKNEEIRNKVADPSQENAASSFLTNEEID